MFGLNKYILYAIIAAVSISILTTFVLMWKHSIRQQALLEINNKQLEQTVKDQQTFIIKMNEINLIQKQELESMNKKNSILSVKIANIEAYLNSDVVINQNTPSSEILKETIRRLNGDLE